MGYIVKSNMKKIFFLFLFLLLFFVPHANAQQNAPTGAKDIFLKAQVVRILKTTTDISDGGYTTITQTLQLKVLEGPRAGSTFTMQQGQDARLASLQLYSPGQTVIVDETIAQDNSLHYAITDKYRMTEIFILLGIFAVFTIAVVGKKGLGALLGLCVSLAVIVLYIVPQMLYNQADPLTVCLIGSFIILFITTFLAHGFSRQTAIAIAATFLALLATYVLSVLAVNISHLVGLGTEDSYLLELSPTQAINPKGLLLGGILIGTLGALNDITTTQVASIAALFKANPAQTFWHLVNHGTNIGREHIASLVNTLVLAYAGTSLPIFIFLLVNPQHLPLWVILNSESFAQEIVRTLAGSAGLILSVPIATLLAAWLTPKIVSRI